MKYKLCLVLILSIAITPFSALAQGGLTFTDLSLETQGANAVVRWTTSGPASGCVDFGLNAGQYDYTLCAATEYSLLHALELINLKSKETYHFRIRSSDNLGGSVESFDQTFKSGERGDTEEPEITNISILYVTGATATIYWETNEPADSRIDYGLTTDYGKRKSSGSRVLKHQLTLTGLTIDRPYLFQITSKDKDGNVVSSNNRSFNTRLTDQVDKSDLQQADIKPIEVGDSRIGATSVLITWRTNKLASGTLRYGTKTGRYSKNIASDLPYNFFHEFSVGDLESNTQYYFVVENKDVFGKTVKSGEYTFKTLPASQTSQVKGETLQETTLMPYSQNSATAGRRQLVRVSGSADYYLLDGSNKHKILSPQILRSYEASVPSGGTIAASELSQFAEVRLVKTADQNKVYFLYLRQGLKKPIPNPTVFNAYPKNRWQDIVIVSQADLNNYEEVKLVKTADNPAVYLLENGERRQIVSPAVFVGQGFSWNKIAIINQVDLESYAPGLVVE